MSKQHQNLRFCQPQPGLDDEQLGSPLATVLAYHERTKHRRECFARGPANLDWNSQPHPHRHYEGCDTIALPFATPELSYHALFGDIVDSAPLTINNIALLLEYALSLAAIKVVGHNRWTVRCNPSSGNLHPTEAYLICGAIDGLSAGVYHYNSEQHVLEQRAIFTSNALDGGCYLALSSVHWREAWKYGERAYRCCQLDVGHAIAALRYAAALLGWRISIENQVADSTTTALCGVARGEDFAGVEQETVELLLHLQPGNRYREDELLAAMEGAQWFGQANLLDPDPFYHWHIIDQVSQACKRESTLGAGCSDWNNSNIPAIDTPVAQLIKQRRSALAFQPDISMEKHAFFAMLNALLVEQRSLPLDLFPHHPRLHPILFVHRVEGMEPGLYCLPRNRGATAALKRSMKTEFIWEPISDQIPLYRLQTGDIQSFAKAISCRQEIASDSAFSLAMLAEFSGTLASDNDAWRYRELFWEAGMLGQILYLEAEAHGYRGTGIDCFFDDVFHQALGLTDQQFQSLYHFTVGTPVLDGRITTLPPYSTRE